MTWEEIWQSVQNFFLTSGLSIVRALLIWVIGYVVIKLVLVILKKIFNKSKMQTVVQSFVLSILKFVLYLVLLIMILATLGVEITGIIAVFASAGLAVGLALQNSLSNVASGIVLMVVQPFQEGDYVSINGKEGKVKDVKILTTSIITLDNKIVIIPNSVVAGNEIINFTKTKKRRVEFLFGVAYESDVELVRKTVLEVMKSNGKVLLNPEPFCSIKNFNSSSVDFFAYCWCDAEDYWDVFFYVMDNVFNEFKRNKISIPFQQVEVRMREDEVQMPIIDRTLIREEKQRKQEKITKLDMFLNNVEKMGSQDDKNKTNKLAKQKEEKKKRK